MSTVIIEGHADACVCCGNLEAATVSCRIRGGTATLCGYSEFTSPSSPPKKYLIKTLSGDRRVDRFNLVDCIPQPTRDCYGTFFFSGTCSYSDSNCALTESGNVSRFWSAELFGPCGPTDNVATCTINLAVNAVGDWGDTVVLTQTVRSITNPLTCINSNAAWKTPTAPTIAETLSSEDTNENAIARLLEGSGGTWGEWIVQGVTGCTGTPPSCCLARYEERTSGFSFVYQESQFRVTATGLTPSTSYNARVEIYRRPYGSGSYALYQTIIVTDTTDGSGNYTADGDVPNDEGFESYADNAFIVIPS